MHGLNSQEEKRYARHLLLPEIGLKGQRKLKEASVLLVGVGGLGSASGLYLAAAGVGSIGIVDSDVVDASNLHRQIVHGESTLGQKKVESAKKRLLDINPHIDIQTYDCKLEPNNALEIMKHYDIVADGTDNFATRYLVNDACQHLGKPNVYASIFRFEGQVSVFDARRGPCYRCLFPNPPPLGEIPSCAQSGVLGVLPGIAGTLQANEVIKLITGIGDPLIGKLLTFDALTMNFHTLTVRKDAKCHHGRDLDASPFAGYALRWHDNAVTEVPAEELTRNALLVDVREQDEWERGRIDGAIHLPLSQLKKRMTELNPRESIVLYCTMGSRSMHAVELLKENGFENVKSLSGGINSWPGGIS